jgi:hypothetical protein
LDSIGKGDLEIGWNDLAHGERQGYLVAKTSEWEVLGAAKDVGSWFVGPGCGSCGVSGNRVWGGKEQEFGLRGSADDERREDEEEQGRAHINSVVVQARISLLGANTGSSRICGRGQDIAPLEATRCMLRTVARATKCVCEMKI